MRLAVVHYHLHSGGVTRVIQNALRAIGSSDAQIVVLASGPPDEPLPCPVGTVPALAYKDSGSPADAADLARDLLKTATSQLGAPPDIWHVHNPGLAKNVLMPDALRQLLEEGARILVQVHDFAEDGRPANFQRQLDYYQQNPDRYAAAVWPNAPQIAYAVLNSRDKQALASAGLPPQRLHFLPNPVLPPDQSPESTPPPKPNNNNHPLLLYPTRAIRRKNLGECLLLARVFPQHHIATTLAPRNPHWSAIHDHWRAVAAELRLPVSFAIAESSPASFLQLIHSASALLTTSVGEGFGMAFLEPFLFQKPVHGRDLPEITNDFRKAGIQFSGLYPEWPVSTKAFDCSALRQRFLTAVSQLLKAYRQPANPTQILEAFDQLTAAGTLDFGRLDETAQTEVLRQPLPRIFPGSNPQPFTLHPTDPPDFSTNLHSLEKHYGLQAYRRRLRQIYTSLLQNTPAEPQPLNAHQLLRAFLHPHRFRFLLS